MLSGVAECIGLFDAFHPAPSHPTLFKEWRESVEDQLDEILEGGATAGEEAEVAAASDACLRGLDLFLQAAGDVPWQQRPVEVRRDHVTRLLRQPQVPQRTAEWYLQGKQVLTASEFSTLFKTPRAISQLVLAKTAGLAAATTAAPITNRLACMTCEMGPFDWGIRFEPVVKQILETRWASKIAESGRLLHPTDKRLAASPDGLILTAADPHRVGRLVEIKCPISRELGGEVPFDYWCQMQLQMEVTDIDECEYVEVKIDSITKQKPEMAAVAEGFVWLFQNPEGACEMYYAYTEEEKVALEDKGYDLLETIPWRIGRLEARVVARDRAWFAGTAEARDKFWLDVAAATAGTFTPAPSSRKPKAAQPAAGKGGLVLNIIKEGADSAVAPSCLIVDE
jgi:hypothetical protein